MNATTIHETESVARFIACLSSAAAVIMFGVAFVTDRALSWHVVSAQLLQIGLILAIFVGYAIAWTKRCEALGSMIALLSMVAAFVSYVVPLSPHVPRHFYFFLAVGMPALFHLMAIALRRYVFTRIVAK